VLLKDNGIKVLSVVWHCAGLLPEDGLQVQGQPLTPECQMSHVISG
jgi:hypothetical protein